MLAEILYKFGRKPESNPSGRMTKWIQCITRIRDDLQNGLKRKSGVSSFMISDQIQSRQNDRNYRRYFDTVTGPEIFRSHVADNLACCAFCTFLSRSDCHGYCFSCIRGAYETCSYLLPGIYPFSDTHFATAETEPVPWIYRIACPNFQRLDEAEYFKNFNDCGLPVTVANYEALEALYTGISRGKKPCHLCASVSLDIYLHCIESQTPRDNSPCTRICSEIACRYNNITLDQS